LGHLCFLSLSLFPCTLRLFKYMQVLVECYFLGEVSWPPTTKSSLAYTISWFTSCHLPRWNLITLLLFCPLLQCKCHIKAFKNFWAWSWNSEWHMEYSQ
jgi:hypothetical protein